VALYSEWLAQEEERKKGTPDEFTAESPFTAPRAAGHRPSPAPAGIAAAEAPEVADQRSIRELVDGFLNPRLGAAEAVSEIRPSRQIPFGVGAGLAAVDQARMVALVLKDNAGALQDEEKAELLEILRPDIERATRGTTIGYDIIKGLENSVGFALDLLTGGAVLRGGLKLAGKAATGKLVAKKISDLAARNAATKVAGRLAGAAAKSAGTLAVNEALSAVTSGIESGGETFGGRVATETYKRMMLGAGVQIKEDELGELSVFLDGEMESFMDALPRGSMAAFIEIFSEQAGELMLPAMRMLSGSVAAKWIGQKAGRTSRDFIKFANKTGYQGIVPEFLEERLADALLATGGGVGLEEQATESPEAFVDAVLPDSWREVVTELGVIVAQGGMTRAAFSAVQGVLGPPQVPATEDSSPPGAAPPSPAEGVDEPGTTGEAVPDEGQQPEEQQEAEQAEAHEPVVQPVRGEPAQEPEAQGLPDVPPEGDREAEGAARPEDRAARAEGEAAGDEGGPAAAEAEGPSPEVETLRKFTGRPVRRAPDERIEGDPELSAIRDRVTESGIDVEFVEDPEGTPLVFDGLSQRPGHIAIDVNAEQPRAVAMHELLGHAAAKALGFERWQPFAERMAAADPAGRKRLLEDYRSRYIDARVAGGLSRVEAIKAADSLSEQELQEEGAANQAQAVAELIESWLSGSRRGRAALARVERNDPGLVRSILDALVKLARKLGIQLDTSLEKDIQRIRKLGKVPQEAPVTAETVGVARVAAELYRVLQAESAAQVAPGGAPRLSAARGPRRVKGGESKGLYVGSPGITSPQALAAWRKRMKALALEGEAGRFWYEESSAEILEAFGGDVVMAEKFVQVLAIMSATTGVGPNFTNALKAWTQWRAGRPIQAGKFGAMDRKVTALLVDGKNWSGRKTNNFWKNLMRIIDPSLVQGVTVDVWMMRGLGYDTKKKAPTPAEYTFAEDEVKRFARDLGWEPQQVQAAIWVAAKAKSEGTPVSSAARHFGTSLRGSLGQISFEAIPGRTSGHLQEQFDAPIEQREEYLERIRGVLEDEQGRNLVLLELGILTPGTDTGPGAFEGRSDPSAQAIAAVPPEHKISELIKTRERAHAASVDPGAVDLMDAAASALGMILKQDAMAWHKPFFKGMAKFRQNGIEVQLGRTLTRQETLDLAEAMERLTGSGSFSPITTGTGARLLNFPEFTGTENAAFHNAAEQAAHEVFGEAGVEVVGFASDGSYIENDWKENPSGEAYQNAGSWAQRPDLRRRVAGLVADLGAQVREVDAEFAAKYGWTEAQAVEAAPQAEVTAAAEPRGPPVDPLFSVAAPVRSPAFRRWFGDSKVVDASGPLVVYHGTVERFTTFDRGAESIFNYGEAGTSGGIYFAETPEEADNYASVHRIDPGANIMPAYLRIENPKIIRDESFGFGIDQQALVVQQAEREGHDGVYLAHENAWVVFSPEQVKSATGNRGTFARATPDVRFSAAAPQNSPNVNDRKRVVEETFEDVGTAELSRIDKARRVIQDLAIPIQRLEERIKKLGGDISRSARRAIALLPGRVQARQVELERAWKKMQRIIRRNRSWGLGKKGALEVIGDYLYAGSAPERNALMKEQGVVNGSGMSDSKAAEIRAAHADKPGLDEIEKLYREVVIEKTRDQMAESGLISEDTARHWRRTEPNYVPMRSAETDAEGPSHVGPRGRGFQVTGPIVYRREGRRTQADNPLIFGFAQAQSYNLSAEKARVGKALWDMLRANEGLVAYTELDPPEDPENWDPKNAFGIWVAGERKVLRLADENVNRAMKGLGYAPVSPLLRLFGNISRFVGQLVTSFNPNFMVPNVARDLQTALVNISAEKQKGVRKAGLRNIFPAMRAIGRDGFRDKPAVTEMDRFYRDVFVPLGGLIGWTREVTYVEKMKNMRSDLTRDPLSRTFLGMLGKIQTMNSVMELSTRLAFTKALVDAGVEPEIAVRAGRELTVDFNRRGEITSNLSAYKMFINARIQGTAQMLINVKRNPVGIATIGGGIFAFGFGMTIMNLLAMGDDDDGTPLYLKKPYWERERNIMLPNPLSDNPSAMFKVPLTYGYNIFYVLGAAAAEAAYRVSRGEDSEGVVGPLVAQSLRVVWDGFSPISDGTILQTLLPSATAPFVQIWENTNWNGTPIMPVPNPFDKAPPPRSERFFNSVSPLSLRVARQLNSWFEGGNEYRAGEFFGLDVSVSPEALEHLFTSYLGGLSKMGSNAIKLTTKPWEDTGWSTVPVIRRFYTDSSPIWSDRAAYYEAREEVYRSDKEVEGGAKTNARRREYARLKSKLQISGKAKGIDEQLTDLRKQEKAERNPDKKRALVEKQGRLYQRFLKSYNAIRAKKFD
jgi:hypothetical protein